MNRLILIGILWYLVIAIGRAQEAAKFLEASQTPTLEIEPPSSLPASEPTPLNGQPSANRPPRPAKSESPKRTAEPKRIVIQPGVDAQESEVVWQFLADLEKAGIAKVSEIEMTPTSESPIVTQVFMREDESFEKIKLFLVDLRASGVEKLVLEFGGLHPEGDADKQHNGLVFRATQGYSQDELQRLEKVVQAAAERCVLSFYLPGTHVVPSGPEVVGPPDKADASSYAPSFRPTVPQLRTAYEAANKQAHDLAESLRQTPDAAKKSELRAAVQRAFSLRQSLLRAELQEMQARLEKTQQSLDMRDRMVDQIVDRRVEDLLNPQLKWDSSAQPLTKDSSLEIGAGGRNIADGNSSVSAPGFSNIKLLIPQKRFLPIPGTEALRVTYDDLDLLKVLNMEPVPANAVEHFPDWLQELNGKTVRIRGFMYPVFESTGLKEFALARDNGICTFVRDPKIYEVIGVDLDEGVTTDYIAGRPFDVEGMFHIAPKTDKGTLSHLYRISGARILPVAAEDMDPQSKDLSKAQSNGGNDDPMQITGSTSSAANALATPETAGPVTELEGDWHRVAYIDKWQTERRPINMTIRANQESATLWTGESYLRTVVIDQDEKTIEVGAHELRGGLPSQVVSERGVYTLDGDVLTIHSETSISDSVSGAFIQKGTHTSIWKRGLCKIEDYDGQNRGPGMGTCHLNGSDENTGLGKLIPGDKVDVLVSFQSKEGSLVQRVLLESIEVDGSIEPKQGRPGGRQIRLLGTREQCLIIDDANMRGVTLSVRRELDGETQEFLGGINTDAVTELKEVAPQKSLDVSMPTPFP